MSPQKRGTSSSVRKCQPVQVNNSATVPRDAADGEDDCMSEVEELVTEQGPEDSPLSEFQRLQRLVDEGRCYIDDNGQLQQGLHPVVVDNTPGKGQKKRIRSTIQAVEQTGMAQIDIGEEEDSMSEVTIYKPAVGKAKTRDSSSSDDVDLADQAIKDSEETQPLKMKNASVLANEDLINESIENLISVWQGKDWHPDNERRHERRQEPRQEPSRVSRDDRPGTSGQTAYDRTARGMTDRSRPRVLTPEERGEQVI